MDILKYKIHKTCLRIIVKGQTAANFKTEMLNAMSSDISFFCFIPAEKINDDLSKVHAYTTPRIQLSVQSFVRLSLCGA